jgi:predicted 3'-5' exonuclease similar to PolB exonuclease domain
MAQAERVLREISLTAFSTRRRADHWAVDAVGAPHLGERTEKQLITAFCDKIAELSPQLVTFNGNSFDLPVLTSPALRRQQAARRAPAPGPQVSSSSSTSPIMSATSSSSSSCSSIKGASPKAGPSSSTSSSASSSAPSITSPSAVFLP